MSLSSSLRAAAELFALWIVALSVKVATARYAVGMVVVSKL